MFTCSLYTPGSTQTASGPCPGFRVLTRWPPGHCPGTERPRTAWTPPGPVLAVCSFPARCRSRRKTQSWLAVFVLPLCAVPCRSLLSWAAGPDRPLAVSSPGHRPAVHAGRPCDGTSATGCKSARLTSPAPSPGSQGQVRHGNTSGQRPVRPCLPCRAALCILRRGQGL